MSDDILIPKRYLSIPDEERMSWPDIRQDYCGVCGKPTQAMHHVVYRSQGGKDGPQVAVCGRGNEDAKTCHGAAHRHDLIFRHDKHGWWWTANERYAPVVERRRKRAGFRARVQPGVEYPYYIKGENTDEPGYHDSITADDGLVITALLDVLEQTAASESEARWGTARAIAQVVAFCEKGLGHRRGSQKAASELIAEQRPDLADRLRLSPSNVNRYITWASVPEEWGSQLGVVLGYAAGRALAAGHEPDVVRENAEWVMAGEYQLSDFEADLLGKEPFEEREKCVCPACGAAHVKKGGAK